MLLPPLWIALICFQVMLHQKKGMPRILKGLLSGSTKGYAWEKHVDFVGEIHKIDYDLHKELLRGELNEGLRERFSLTSKSIGSDPH